MSLIDDIRSGSNDAIKQLYQENAQDIYDFAKGITGDHDTAMQATKNTLTKLVQQIQNGNEPANIHSEALKLAYDEACKIAMPSVQNIKSPYDDEKDMTTVEPEAPQRQYAEEEPAKVKRQRQPKRKELNIEDEYDDYEEADEYAPVSRRTQPRGRKEPRQEMRQEPRRYDDYDEYDSYDEYDDYYEEEKRRHGAGFYICLIFNIILVLLLIWFLIGLLINLSVIPDSLYHTLGYEWFDTHIYQLFG